MPALALRPAKDAGFTMIEVLTVIAMMGIVLSIGVFGWTRWSQANEQAGAASTVEAALRDAQQRAVTEGSSVCVQFSTTAQTWTTLRGACGSTTSTLQGPVPVSSKRVHLADPPAPTTSCAAGVTFRSRGTATTCALVVTRDGSTHQITIKVEGLTGRVLVA